MPLTWLLVVCWPSVMVLGFCCITPISAFVSLCPDKKSPFTDVCHGCQTHSLTKFCHPTSNTDIITPILKMGKMRPRDGDEAAPVWAARKQQEWDLNSALPGFKSDSALSKLRIHPRAVHGKEADRRRKPVRARWGMEGRGGRECVQKHLCCSHQDSCVATS